MKFVILIFLLTFFHPAHAFNKDLTVNEDRVPYEFKVLFEDLKTSALVYQEQAELVSIALDLNQSLGKLNKDHLYFLLKSEIYKHTLEFQLSSKKGFNLNSFALKRLKDKFDRYKAQYGGFAKWLIQSLFADCKPFEEAGLITTTAVSPTSLSSEKYILYQKFSRLLKYLGPWFDRLETLSPQEFNQFTRESNINTLKHLKLRGKLFYNLTQNSFAQEKIDLVNIPESVKSLITGEDLSQKSNNSAPSSLTLEEKSEKEELKAQDQVDKLDTPDMSKVSDDINKELEEKVLKDIEPNAAQNSGQ